MQRTHFAQTNLKHKIISGVFSSTAPWAHHLLCSDQVDLVRVTRLSSRTLSKMKNWRRLLVEGYLPFKKIVRSSSITERLRLSSYVAWNNHSCNQSLFMSYLNENNGYKCLGPPIVSLLRKSNCLPSSS